MHDDAVSADRFRYQLTMLEVFIWKGLTRLLDTHVAYEIAIYKISTGNCFDAKKRSLMQDCSETLV